MNIYIKLEQAKMILLFAVYCNSNSITLNNIKESLENNNLISENYENKPSLDVLIKFVLNRLVEKEHIRLSESGFLEISPKGKTLLEKYMEMLLSYPLPKKRVLGDFFTHFKFKENNNAQL